MLSQGLVVGACLKGSQSEYVFRALRSRSMCVKACPHLELARPLS
jgi:hypothetical protein